MSDITNSKIDNMAKFQIGDKVKFLNQVGGGVVTKVTDDFVFVEDETGFDVPMLPNELIRMADMTGAGKMFNQKVAGQVPMPNKDNPAPAPKAVQTPEDEIKALKNQVANLKDQVAKLKKQLESLQRTNAKSIADNILIQHMVGNGEAEVDLHIEMLTAESAKLAPHEAFELQMRYFRTCMNHAIANNVKKVTFIHGVGKGILKDEIQKELKQYDGIYTLDAPMLKYGVGAIEVYFSNK